MPRQISDETIFAAALETIARRGYAGATTKQIAAAAGINEVTLFRRHGSKAKLLAAALGAEVERFEASGGAGYTGALECDLVRVVELYAALVGRGGRLLPIILAELPRDPALGEVVARVHEVIGAVAGLLERYQDEGKLRPEPALQAVAALFGPLLVGALLGPLDVPMRPPSIDPAAHVERYLQGRATPS